MRNKVLFVTAVIVAGLIGTWYTPRLYIVARNGTLMQIQESPPIEEVGGECGCDSKK